MRKKIIVFAGFILMTVGFSMFQCSCKQDYTLDSVDMIPLRITEKEAETLIGIVSSPRYFNYRNIYRQDEIATISFDSLAIIVNINYVWSSPYNETFFKMPVTREKIIDIIITSNKNYNANYPAGSNLKGIISVWHSGIYDFSTIDAVLKELSVVPSPLYYMFNTPPETEEIHDLTIIFRTDRKRIVTTTVKNVKILK